MNDAQVYEMQVQLWKPNTWDVTWGVVTKRMDECLASRVTDEGVDHVGVGDVGELIVLLGEPLDVLSKGLVDPLPVVAKVP
jgi:hypothetical protein